MTESTAMSRSGAQRLILTGWRGGTVGLRVAADSRRAVFLPLRKTLRRVEVELPGRVTGGVPGLLPRSGDRSSDPRRSVGGWRSAKTSRARAGDHPITMQSLSCCVQGNGPGVHGAPVTL